MRQLVTNHKRLAAIADLRHALARRDYAEVIAQENRASGNIAKLSSFASEIRNNDNYSNGASLAASLGYADRMLSAGVAQRTELKKLSAQSLSKNNDLRIAEGVSALASARLKQSLKVQEQKEGERYSFIVNCPSNIQKFGSVKR